MNQCQSTLICENLWLNYKPFLKKQTQFFPVSSPKTTIYKNQSQFKPNSNPIQTQFFGLKMNNLVYPACPAIAPQGRRRIIFLKNTVLICVNQCLNIIRGNSWLKTIPFYAKQTQTFPFSAQKPRFRQKTNPKQTQNKPKTNPNKANWQNTQNQPIPFIDKAL